ncbi:MAG: TetR/AcrR family transcriptional regulator, partial [Bifidobacteriaceae bacterium]|nr:TetR/AcrR family transcriptional regulator [Bifidobacteriaceae bacterium]
MTRIVKQAEVRRDEILDAAARLFVAKGYAATTICDLLDEVGIARGTLYYHFRSKEDVLDGLVHRHGDRVLAGLREVTGSGLPLPEKLMACIAALSPQNSTQAALVDELGRASDTALFSKTLDDIVVRLAPVIGGVVAEGVDAGVLHTAYPVEATRILLVAAYVLLDNRALKWTEQDRAVQVAALTDAAERLLG